jgi:hypothetical protein
MQYPFPRALVPLIACAEQICLERVISLSSGY